MKQRFRASSSHSPMPAGVRRVPLRFFARRCEKPCSLVPSGPARSFQRLLPVGHGSKALQEQFFPPRQGPSERISGATLAAACRRPATRKGTTGTHRSGGTVLTNCFWGVCRDFNEELHFQLGEELHAMMSKKCVRVFVLSTPVSFLCVV